MPRKKAVPKIKQVVYAESQEALGFKTVRVWLPAEEVENFKAKAAKARLKYLDKLAAIES